VDALGDDSNLEIAEAEIELQGRETTRSNAGQQGDRSFGRPVRWYDSQSVGQGGSKQKAGW
jgi:hypothetical protein